MTKDPDETTDLYEQKPEEVKAITDLLEGIREQG